MSSVKKSTASRRNIDDGGGAPIWRRDGGDGSFRQASTNLRPSVGKFTNKQYLNVLQSVGQSVHVLDLNTRIIFWNAMSEQLYGYSAEEVVGQNPISVMVDDRDAAFALNVAQRCLKGETWTGEFPVKTRSGKIFPAITTCSPFYDDNGSLIGIISITAKSASYHNQRISLAKANVSESETCSSPARNSFASRLGLDRLASKEGVISKLGLDSEQPVQVAIASKISNLASKVSNKVKSKMRVSDSNNHHQDHKFSSAILSNHKEDVAPRGDFIQSPFGVFTDIDEKFSPKPFKDSLICKVPTSKVEEWMVEKSLLWPCKENEKKKDKSHQIINSIGAYESNKPTNTEESSLWSSSTDTNNTSNVSSSSSVMDTNNELDYEILWDDLIIGKQIGQGSCGIVYHGLWFGSDVAVKVFSKQEYSKEVVHSFRQEVSLMKRLRHPNVLLFMGAVTSLQRLCIVSEFVPRGSLFLILRKNTAKLDWKRRIQMALDIARGMNYLHCCSPPIVHRDLKSSNLLVDRNWTVKVADFGLSRIKHETYLTTKSGKGTPQWMAPEVLRNESADEKSDIYSFGVVLWELATEKIPWETLNSMQVIGAVAFRNQRLEIPKDIDLRWISLIESCWHSDTKLRPTFQELIEKLRDMQRTTKQKKITEGLWSSG